MKDGINMTKLTPTSEQQAIIDEAKLGSNLVVRAYAGSAKTSTCTMVSEVLVKTSLYVAFNKSIAEEAATKFPKHVDCRTMHSLAYREVMNPMYRLKLRGYFNMNDIDKLSEFKDFCKTGELDILQIKLDIVDCIKKYCQSKKKRPFVPKKLLERYGDNILPTVVQYWHSIIDASDTTTMTHDVYLKLYQLSQPILPAQVIYLDEAQDSNEVTLDIVLSQAMYGSQIILVGDSYQSIYGWRGAVNALDTLPDSFKELYLTISFRFTQDIADKATKLLSYLGNTTPITGKGIPTVEIPTKVTIVRNNSTLIEDLLDASKKGQKVYVLADLKSVWSKLYHIAALKFGNDIHYPDKELLQYKSYKQLLEASESLPEIAKLLTITSILIRDDTMHNSIQTIKSVIVKKAKDADYTLTTGHKSKGLEWDEVTLASDLFNIPEDYEGSLVDLLLEDQTGCLLYVCLTRAKSKVNLPKSVAALI